MLKRFVAYYRPYKLMFFLDMAASFFISLIGMVYPIISRTMLNDLIPNRNLRMVVCFGIALLVLYIIRMLLRYFVQYQGHMIGVNMQADMRRDMFRHLEKLPYSFYDEHETGRIMSRMTNDCENVSNAKASTISISTAPPRQKSALVFVKSSNMATCPSSLSASKRADSVSTSRQPTMWSTSTHGGIQPSKTKPVTAPTA